VVNWPIKARRISFQTILVLVTRLLTFARQTDGMFFPPNFNLEELESDRRRHVILAASATAVPIMQMHLSLAELYQDRATALARSSPTPDRHEIGEPDLVAGERRSTAR
jgi:hypothetical protein